MSRLALVDPADRLDEGDGGRETVRTVRGISVPAVGLGTWRLTGEQCRESVRAALEGGYRHVDTAQAYGNERRVGEGLREGFRAADVDRESVFLTTKLARSNRSREAVRESTAASLERLGTDYVDLLLVHSPNLRTPLGETLAAMDELVDDGLVRHVGVSNFGLERLDRARRLTRHGLLANQVLYNPYVDRGGLLDYCRIHDVLLTAYSPLCHGAVVRDPVLREVGDSHGKSPAQVAIRWLLQQPNVATVPKATSREHLEANRDVFDFELSAAEMERVRRPSILRVASGFVRSWLGGYLPKRCEQ